MSADFILGGIAYTTAQLATLPFDFMKAQAQVRYANHMTANSRPLHFGREAISVGGLSRLFVGADALIARALIYNSMRGALFVELTRSQAAKDRYKSVPTWLRTTDQCFAAAIGGFFATPFDLVLLRMQTDNNLANPRGYRSLLDGLTKASAGGTSDLFIGGSANSMKWAGLVLGAFSVYDYFIEFWPRVLGEVFYNKALALSMAAFSGCALSMPFDNIKTKLQYQHGKANYKSFGDCFNKTLAREGFYGLYVGFWHYYTRYTVGALATIWLVDSLRSSYYG